MSWNLRTTPSSSAAAPRAPRQPRSWRRQDGGLPWSRRRNSRAAKCAGIHLVYDVAVVAAVGGGGRAAGNRRTPGAPRRRLCGRGDGDFAAGPGFPPSRRRWPSGGPRTRRYDAAATRRRARSRGLSAVRAYRNLPRTPAATNARSWTRARGSPGRSVRASSSPRMARGSPARCRRRTCAVPPAPRISFAFKARFCDSALPRDLMPLLAFPGGYGGMVHADGGRVSLSCCIRRDELAQCRQRWPRAKSRGSGSRAHRVVLQGNSAGAVRGAEGWSMVVVRAAADRDSHLRP